MQQSQRKQTVVTAYICMFKRDNKVQKKQTVKAIESIITMLSAREIAIRLASFSVISLFRRLSVVSVTKIERTRLITLGIETSNE